MGRPKALVRLGGELLVERGVRLLRAGGCAPVLVVLGAGAHEVPELDAEVVVNAGWAGGMGSSLRAGLAALEGPSMSRDPSVPEGPSMSRDPSVPGTAAVIVALVDQPLVGPEVIRRLISAWERDAPDAVVATYGGRRRNPVLLSARVWAGVADGAVGDVGARAWLASAYDARVVEVPCDDAGSPADVDTPEQLAALEADRKSLAWN
jgi:nicotine blue oxidoreductase